MGQGEHDVEIRGVNDLSPALVHPELCFYSLAVGAAAVAAGTVMDFLIAAVRADAEVKAEPFGFAVHDVGGSPALDAGLESAAV